MSRLFASTISVTVLILASVLAAGCGGTSDKELGKSETRAKAQEKALNPEAAAEEEAMAESEKMDEKPADKTEEKAQEKPAEKKDEKTEEKAEEKSEGDAENGKGLFVTSCGGCHTLSDAGTAGAAGPKLDGLGWSYDKILDQINNGKGAMPPGTASGSDAEDISAYVAEVAK